LVGASVLYLAYSLVRLWHLAAKNLVFKRIQNPILDVMQTMRVCLSDSAIAFFSSAANRLGY